MLATPPRQWGFGPFTCEAAGGHLAKHGRSIKLQEQPRQVLLALVERAGEVVSRDDLRRRLWSDDTFVDVDNGLNVAIRKLREALGDTGPSARYVETVRGHGYRFIAPVVPIGSEANLQPVVEDRLLDSAPPLLAPPQPVVRPSWLIPMLGSLLLVAAAVLTLALRSPSPQPVIDALVVFPFRNLLGDESVQFLVDGLTASVTSELATRLRVRVTAPASARLADAMPGGVAEAARALAVDAVLTGAVARSRDGVVFTVTLVEAATDHVPWSGRFERTGLDALVESNDIVDAVLAGVGRRASGADARAHAAHAVAPEARAAYLRGRFFWAKRDRASIATALGFLSDAIQLQPDYAEAWAALADVYAIEAAASAPLRPWSGDPVRTGIDAAQEAIRLEPAMGEAHAALGKLMIGQRRWVDAERELRLAVQLSPQYSTAHQWLGTMYLRLHRCDEALAQVEAGAALDPLTALVNEAVGTVYRGCGEPERAIEILQRVLAMHPGTPTTTWQLGRALVDAGRADEAIALLQPMVRAGDQSGTVGTLLLAFAKAGRTAEFRALESTVTSPYLKAVAAAAVGDRSRVLERLDQALATEPVWFHALLDDPAFHPYADDPGFEDLARRAGFPVPPIPPGRFAQRTSPRAATSQ